MPWTITTTKELAIQLSTESGSFVKTIRVPNPKDLQYINKATIAAKLEPFLKTKTYAPNLSSDTANFATLFSEYGRDYASGTNRTNYTKVANVNVVETTKNVWHDEAGD